MDTSFYWYADLADLYGEVWTLDAPWVYPPPLAVAIAPLHTLGWPLFVALWTVAMFFALWVATREWFIPVILTSAIGMAVPAGVVTGPEAVNVPDRAALRARSALVVWIGGPRRRFHTLWRLVDRIVRRAWKRTIERPSQR